MILASNSLGFEHMSTQTLNFHHHVWSCGRWSGTLWSVLIFPSTLQSHIHDTLAETEIISENSELL